MAGKGVPMEEITVSSLPVFGEIPAGWSVVKGALTSPCGYELISNGKSRFSHEYQKGLVKLGPPLQKEQIEDIPWLVPDDKEASSSFLPLNKPEKQPGISFSDEPELPEKLNRLAREEMKLMLLRDIARDVTICKIEGWDYKDYLHELKEEIERFLHGG